MLELPETTTIARQINETLIGKRVRNVIVLQSPHKFAWFHGDPQNYNSMLAGKTINNANGCGSWVEIKADGVVLLFGDGVSLRFHDVNEQHPKKHQLLIEFEDSSALSASVQMYGALYCFNEGELDNPYYKVAKEKPSPLTIEFDEVYFDKLASTPELQKLSAKAFLATEQRIPGLGNGILQDILWKAKIHPKRKLNTLAAEDKKLLYTTIKALLSEMTGLGGRDTEKDLFGNSGGYRTMMSKNTAGLPCMTCGGYIKKESYMGGSVYFCESCQKVPFST